MGQAVQKAFYFIVGNADTTLILLFAVALTVRSWQQKRYWS